MSWIRRLFHKAPPKPRMSRYDYMRSQGVVDPEAVLTEVAHKTDFLERDNATEEWRVKQKYVAALKQIIAKEDAEKQRLKRLEEKL